MDGNRDCDIRCLGKVSRQTYVSGLWTYRDDWCPYGAVGS
jgi:hypothetical protein